MQDIPHRIDYSMGFINHAINVMQCYVEDCKTMEYNPNTLQEIQESIKELTSLEKKTIEIEVIA